MLQQYRERKISITKHPLQLELLKLAMHLAHALETQSPSLAYVTDKLHEIEKISTKQGLGTPQNPGLNYQHLWTLEAQPSRKRVSKPQDSSQVTSELELESVAPNEDDFFCVPAINMDNVSINIQVGKTFSGYIGCRT